MEETTSRTSALENLRGRSSSDNLDAKYVDAAKALGETIAARGHELVFGGYDKGLMDDVANTAVAAGGRVFGVTTGPHRQRGAPLSKASKAWKSPTFPRIKHMVSMSDAFVTLPGGPARSKNSSA